MHHHLHTVSLLHLITLGLIVNNKHVHQWYQATSLPALHPCRVVTIIYFILAALFAGALIVANDGCPAAEPVLIKQVS
jgi:tryptophan-rich sensory protein